LSNVETGNNRILNKKTEVESIIYGVRRWAQRDLFLIDELVLPGTGLVMYTVTEADDDSVTDSIKADLLGVVNPHEDWTTFSLKELAESFCKDKRRRIVSLHDAIRFLIKAYGGYISLIPISRAMATIEAGSREKENLALKTYFRDSRGRLISHIKIHKAAAEVK